MEELSLVPVPYSCAEPSAESGCLSSTRSSDDSIMVLRSKGINVGVAEDDGLKSRKRLPGKGLVENLPTSVMWDNDGW